MKLTIPNSINRYLILLVWMFVAVGTPPEGMAKKKDDDTDGDSDNVTVIGTPGAEEPEKYHFTDNMLLSKELQINGPVIIVADRDVNPNNNSITLTANGSLTMYVQGNLNMHGNSAFNNNGKPSKLMLYGTRKDNEGQQDMVVAGNGYFCGVVYAPNAHVMKNGGGSSGATIGSIAAKKVTFNGSPGPFHYDESLKNVNVSSESGAYVVNGYEIITNRNQQTEVEGTTTTYANFINGFFDGD